MQLEEMHWMLDLTTSRDSLPFVCSISLFNHHYFSSTQLLGTQSRTSSYAFLVFFPSSSIGKIKTMLCRKGSKHVLSNSVDKRH